MLSDAADLRAQRDRPAVLKLRLSILRSKHPCVLVFVLEGNDDLKAYEAWIKRGADDVFWEPIVASGKKNALRFFDMLSRDTTGLRRCTSFLLDHDYDGMRGRPLDRSIYLLPAHSIENYFSHDDVVAALLRTEFKVLGDPDLRSGLLEKYKKAKAEFCENLKEACTTLCATRASSCGRVEVRENCLDFVAIAPDGCRSVDPDSLQSLVTTEQQLSVDAMNDARNYFRERDISMWIRGKYMADFLRAWGIGLMQDRKSDAPLFFPEPSAGHSLSGEWNAIASLAAKCPVPEGLIDFVRRSKSECDDSSRRVN